MNSKQLSDFTVEFRNNYIGKQFEIQQIKTMLNDTYQAKVKDIMENENVVSINIDTVNMMDHEMNICISKLDIIVREGIIAYLIVEQETNSIMINSVKQRYYFDKENELFVSSIKMDEKMAWNNLCYETMMKYNEKFFYQDRYSMKEAAINFNNDIFDEIRNGKTIEEIKEIYSSEEEMEETL